MTYHQHQNSLQVRFSTSQATYYIIAGLSIVDLDRHSDMIVGVEVPQLLHSERMRHVPAWLPLKLPVEVAYDAISDGLYVRLNRDKNPHFPVRSLCQPRIVSLIMLSDNHEIVGLHVVLPPSDPPWTTEDSRPSR